MGLDVYLVKKLSRYDHWNKLEEESNTWTREHYNQEIAKLGKNKHNELTEEEAERISAECEIYNLNLGLNKYGSYRGTEKEEYIDMDSVKYPLHLFKIGYFRSSYNTNGYNSVVSDLIGKSLYDIFEPGDEYHVFPNWEESLERAKEVLELFDKKVDGFENISCSRVESWGVGQDEMIFSRGEALEKYKEQVRKMNNREGPQYDFTNTDGLWVVNHPLKVKAVLMGKFKALSELPAAYVIYENEEGEGLLWYRNATEIVIETIEWVLSQPDLENYFFHWSG